jgi:hypothetical protein
MNATVIVNVTGLEDVTKMVNAKTAILSSKSFLISTLLMFALHVTTHAPHAEGLLKLIVTPVLQALTSTVANVCLVTLVALIVLDLQTVNVPFVIVPMS